MKSSRHNKVLGNCGWNFSFFLPVLPRKTRGKSTRMPRRLFDESLRNKNPERETNKRICFFIFQNQQQQNIHRSVLRIITLTVIVCEPGITFPKIKINKLFPFE
jgi:hypothetical protein